MSDSTMVKWEAVSTEPELSPKAAQFVEEINTKREHGIRAGKETLAAELRLLNVTRELGILLGNAKADLSATQWKLAQARFEFNEQQVQGLLDFARKFPEPITDAREAVRSLVDSQMALGLADYPEGHGEQEIRTPNFALEFTKRLTSVRADLQKQIARSPVDTWSPQYAAQLVAIAEPYLRDVSEIVTAAKLRAAA